MPAPYESGALSIAKTLPRMRCGRCWLDAIVVGQIREYAYRRSFQLLMSCPYRLALGERWVLGLGWVARVVRRGSAVGDGLPCEGLAAARHDACLMR